MVIFHCYVSLPEGTWTLLLNQGVLISFTWNLNCSRASGCIYSIYIVFIVCLCVSYWVLTRISMDWPLMIAKIEKTYPHDIPRISSSFTIIPHSKQPFSPIFQHQNHQLPAFPLALWHPHGIPVGRRAGGARSAARIHGYHLDIHDHLGENHGDFTIFNGLV